MPPLNTGFEKMNQFGKEGIPFLFIIDFDGNQVIVTPLDQVDRSRMLYSFNGKSNLDKPLSIKDKLTFRITPVSSDRYQQAFELVQQHLHYGDSFLLNLTMPSVVESNYSLQEIFYSAYARYKLWMKDRFVVFSPETFVTIEDSIIRSFPMKGTIDASIADAERKLLESEKELAEHYTIVDLIRNDLSMVSKNVRVERFRYIERLETYRNCLLQMSSEIAGDLSHDYHENIGTILSKMLPAGSITGAPKKRTVEIIRQAEQYERGFYTGVMGIFDGTNLDSAVMIRFVEQTPGGLIYKSGGGITTRSRCDEEYQELMDKIYVPVA
ncbi:MAG: aminodeoxychorismate synthase component I [Bacteroidetes bacterium HGW-Bacteroidetes-16]|nr:MAG: aminodeoxychorismate synthase component I [Bacteroidetes bacterium HGW-Bacteroidetes-16]